MRRFLCAALFGFCVTHYAQAQMGIQKLRLRTLSFQYRSTKPGEGRCVQWYPLRSDVPNKVQYTARGEPYIDVRVKARIDEACEFKTRPSESFRMIARKGKYALFSVRVNPPVTVVYFDGPDFRDELLFEAPVERYETVGFFNFFRDSRVYFESRYSQLGHESSINGKVSTTVVPIFGGSIAVPFPWVRNIFLGYSMFQNLGNLKTSGPSLVQYSEFAFDLRYMWTGKESWGRPLIAGIVDYRGRNLYQTSGPKEFVVGSAAMFGFGADLSWYFGALASPWENWLSRVGLESSFRTYLGGKLNGYPYSSNIYEIGLSYRVSKSWALGAGYSAMHQQVDIGDTTGIVKEKATNYYLRLTFVPYRQEGIR